MTLKSGRARRRMSNRTTPSIPPKGWFETTITGPVFGMLSRSASSRSTRMRIPSRTAGMNAGCFPDACSSRAS